uniref:Odorant receptor n=1 Tax=Plutella xylostella TaxID=51655 RepID=A0A2K5B185_PLUXY|nr:olfactory receptor41 [Plutella xylostella]
MKPRALSLDYVRVVRLFLWFNGAWPGDELGEHVPLFIRYHKYHVLGQFTLGLAGEVNFLRKFYKDISFLMLGHVYITTFLTLVTLVRSSLPHFREYRNIIKIFLTEFHLCYHKHKGKYEAKICAFWDWLSYWFALYQMALMVLGMTLFNALPVYKSIQAGAFTTTDLHNKSLEFAVYYTTPLFHCYDHFYLATTLNLYVSYLTSCSVCAQDLLLSLMIFQIIGHIQILNNSIENIPIAKGLKYNMEENTEVGMKLIAIIDHHREIVRFAANISSFFGPMLAINYMFHLVSGCILLLECSRPDPETLARFGPLTVIVFGELIQISVIFEIVGYISEKLIDAVYCMPWESMDVSNQKTVKFFLSRIQTPIQLTAMGIVPVGVQTMLKILKTTFSYFALLKSMNE